MIHWINNFFLFNTDNLFSQDYHFYKTEQKAGIKNSKDFTEFLHQFSHKSVITKLVSNVNTGYVGFPLGHKLSWFVLELLNNNNFS